MQTPSQVLEDYFLETRCMLVEIAATLDRFDRAVERDGGMDDERLNLIYDSLSLLADRNGTPDRSERLLNLYSDLD